MLGSGSNKTPEKIYPSEAQIPDQSPELESKCFYPFNEAFPCHSAQFDKDGVTHEVLADGAAEDEQRNGRPEERLEEALVPESPGAVRAVVLDWTSVGFVDSVGAKAVKQVVAAP